MRSCAMVVTMLNHCIATTYCGCVDCWADAHDDAFDAETQRINFQLQLPHVDAPDGGVHVICPVSALVIDSHPF